MATWEDPQSIYSSKYQVPNWLVCIWTMINVCLSSLWIVSEKLHDRWTCNLLELESSFSNFYYFLEKNLFIRSSFVFKRKLRCTNLRIEDLVGTSTALLEKHSVLFSSRSLADFNKGSKRARFKMTQMAWCRFNVNERNKIEIR